MRLSTRTRYGFRATLELAVEYGKGPLQIKVMAEREKISNKYLEQIITILKSSGLVLSMRGPKGGYILAKPPSEIGLGEIFSVLEGPVVTVECVEHPDYCPRCTTCVTRKVWAKIHDAIFDVLNSMTLQDLADSINGSGKSEYQI